jgi:HEAT repeat protein
MAAALLAFGPQAIEPLIKTLRRRTCLGDEETPASIGRRAAAARVLGELGEARAAKALRPLLDDPAPEVRVEAAVALTHLAEGEVCAEAVSTLIAALDAEPARLSWRAEEGLSDAGTAAVCLIAQALEAALVEENNAGREPLSPATLVRMIRLLGRWPSPGVVGVLRSVAIDSDLTLRAEAIRALGRLRDPEGIPLLVYVLEKDENPGMRAVAAEALGMFTREAVVGPLVGALQDRHPTVRQARPTPSRSLVRSPDPTCGRPSRNTVGRCRGIASDWSGRRVACCVASELTGKPDLLSPEYPALSRWRRRLLDERHPAAFSWCRENPPVQVFAEARG